MLLYALFRWESAAILAMTLILAVFVRDPFQGTVSFWRWWMWIVLGVLALVLIVGTTLTDPDARAQIATQLIRAQFDLDDIADLDLRQRIASALECREQMESMLQRTRDGRQGTPLGAMADDVTNWIAAQYALARRIDDYRSDAVLHRNRSTTSTTIKTLQRQLAGTTDPKKRAEIERTLAEKQSEWTQLERMDKLIESAASQLAASQGAMETIYTQMQLNAARGADRRRTNRSRNDGRIVQQLRADVADRMRILSDLEQEIDKSHQQVIERA